MRTKTAANRSVSKLLAGVFGLAVTIAFSSAALAAEAVAFQWVRAFDAHVGNQTQGFGTAIDSEGNAYLAGSFRSAGEPVGRRLSVAKFDADGEVIWVRHLTTDGHSEIGAMALDGEDNLYLTGFIAGDMFETRDDEHPLVNNTGSVSAFLLKLDPNGTVLDAWALAGGISAGVGVTVDSSGNVIIGGVFNGDIDFDPDQGGAILEGEGGFDGFLAKWNPAGSFQWARSIAGTGWLELHGVTVDADDNVYATGWTNGPATFGPGPGATPLDMLGEHDVLVIKVDAAGNLQWHRIIGGGAKGKGRAVAVAPSGNIIVAGEVFGHPAESGSDAGEDSLPPGGFVASMTADGAIQWAQGFDGIGSPFLGLAVDAAGRIYLAGAFIGALDFRTGDPADTFESQDRRDAFVAQFAATGQFRWARVAQGEGGIYGHGIAASGEQDVVFTGYFQGAADFDPGSGEHVITSGGAVSTSGGAFIAKLTVPEHNPYDITGDGKVTAVDVQLVINAALGLAVPYATDVSGTGVTNAVDVQLVINAALGIPAP